MESAEFKIDTEKVMNMFSEFGRKERKKTYRNAVKESLNIVKKQVLTNLSGVIQPKKITKKDKYGMSFKKGIVTKVYRTGDAGVIHIMKNFKMKFFELGTKERYARHYKKKLMKKQRHTGSIKAYHYFQSAKDTTEKQVFSLLEERIKEEIIKINNKYKGK